jgi:hypothetical protein
MLEYIFTAFMQHHYSPPLPSSPLQDISNASVPVSEEDFLTRRFSSQHNNIGLLKKKRKKEIISYPDQIKCQLQLDSVRHKLP